MRPPVRYAMSGDIEIAYQVLGEGPDVIWVAGWLTHLDVLWDHPGYRRFCEELASFSRLILFDKRGMGLSQRVRVGTLEERMDDVRAVLDAVGSEQAVLVGVSEGGPLSMLFAATHPERTQALVLVGAEVKEETTDDWPWGEATREEHEATMARVPELWGAGGRGSVLFFPDDPDAEASNSWFARLQTASATPQDAVAFMDMGMEIDVRDVAPSIRVPTLILHRVEDPVCHVEAARFLAANIPSARYVELPGSVHIPWASGGDDILDEIREFLTGAREAPEPSRVLATVLFTDIVGSTERATELGDRRWREALEAHHATIRRELERFRGREIDTAGDGFLANFDGPARAIRCAVAAVDAVRPLGLEIRAGVHTGECEIVGDKLAGVAVHIGARVAGKAGPGEVLVSRTVHDLVAGSGLRFDDRGEFKLKGVQGEWRLYAVSGGT
ncbi:MAG TPA: adenylate/guanylate cyclase domain-containing protein [Gaiellaceae bacterium]|nr:adenylate/guanylate cyclase domain-containing protein [Gaiellaceae bacterium]